MNARTILIFIATLLLSAGRSPAPIVEEEKPTPVPEQSAKSKPRRTTQSEDNRTTKSRPAATPATTPAKKFAGKWSGTMPEVPWGNVQTELIVDPSETTMEWRDSLNKWKPATAKATFTGATLSALFPGWPRPVWSITPDPGGNTAQVRLQAFMNDDHAVFQRVSR